MIRREIPNGWLLIAQTAHAALSGSFAALWTRTALTPRRSVICAIGRHDDGWRGWERAPRAGGDSGRPLDFPEISLDDAVEIWTAGPAAVARDDPYAGILVSRHGSALMERKLAFTEPGSDKAARLERYLASQRRLRADLIHEHGPPPAHLGRQLDGNLHLLQLLDFLSLLLCWKPVRPRRLAFGRPEDPFWLDLGPISERSAPDLRTALRVRASIFPWPFGRPTRRRFRVAAHRVEPVSFDDRSLQRALEAPGARTALEIDLEAGPGPRGAAP